MFEDAEWREYDSATIALRICSTVFAVREDCSTWLSQSTKDSWWFGTSVQGFPVTFSIAGKQYLAVTTGLGDGSPRNVPRTIFPDVHRPLTGNALYLFTLPDAR